MEEYKSPVYNVISVPIDKVVANTYNPNVVAPPEMKLLELSIWEDGYTMPCVCYYIPEKDIYELVDGFHRYKVMKIIPTNIRTGKGIAPRSRHQQRYFQPHGLHPSGTTGQEVRIASN